MISTIKNTTQYQEYLKLTYDLMQNDLKPDTVEYDKLELLSILIEVYEKEHHPVEPPHPIEAILFRLEQMNLKKSELNKILGNRSRTSEILSGKRKLSLAMIRKLNESLNIPAEVLIQDYEVV